MSAAKIFAKTWALSATITVIIYWAYILTTGTFTDVITSAMIDITLGMISFPFSFIIQLFIDTFWAFFQLAVFCLLLLVFYYTDEDYSW